MYAKCPAFFEIAQALILNFLQSRQIATFYECIKVDARVKSRSAILEMASTAFHCFQRIVRA